ncbi:MAG: DUF1064 domain-containing protein [Nitrosopumilus sp.]
MKFSQIKSKNLKNLTKKFSKYNAIACEEDGFKFPSRMELNYYRKLKLLKMSGEVLYFLRQVPFHLPGGVKYVVDFVEFWRDGNVVYVDVKGYDTPLSKSKRKIVESLYPVKIEIFKKK